MAKEKYDIDEDLSDIELDNDSLEDEVKDVDLDELEQGFSSSNNRRRLIFFAVTAAIFGSLYFAFKNKDLKKIKDPLNSLAYEAMAMEEDRSGERLYLPSTKKSEIVQYFENSRELTFKPRSLSPLPKRWRHDGASIIDYEVAKIAVAQYSDRDSREMLFFFTFAGSLEDLESSENAEVDGFKYQPYASDRINMVAWQDNHETLAVLMGHQSIENLAKHAKLGSPSIPQLDANSDKNSD